MYVHNSMSQQPENNPRATETHPVFRYVPVIPDHHADPIVPGGELVDVEIDFRAVIEIGVGTRCFHLVAMHGHQVVAVLP